jgi:lipoprotein-releasing system ATP-binding protein
MNALLELKNVTKHYAAPDAGESLTVLGDVNLQVQRGEAVAIVGPSGSGKSTLLNIMGGLDTPSSGEVLLDGNNLARLGERELAAVRNREIGFVFQLHHLLPQCSVLENVLIPTLAASTGSTAAETEQRARQLLQHVGLESRLHHRPGQLSGGERQRVAVVRALINHPKLLLADEPTGALDRASAEALADLLVELNREEAVALVVVTHWPELAARMPRGFELRNGTLAQRIR